jgi:hypothetical protein
MAIPGDMVQRGLGDGRAMMDSRWVDVLSGAVAASMVDLERAMQPGGGSGFNGGVAF